MQQPYRAVDPATGEVVATFESPADVDPALALAQEAFRTWSVLPVTARATLLRALARRFAEHARDLAVGMRREMGKTLEEGLEEVAYCSAILDHYATTGPDDLAEQTLSTALSGSTRLQYRPLGPLLAVMPWNFPCYQTIRLAAPNLLLGNTLVVKPAESTPLTALLIERLVAEAGLPAGAFVTLFATHRQVERIVADDRIRGVSLTGSERAGAAVAASAGRHLKKCVLELGGSDPFVVLDHADPSAVAELAWHTRMYNNGQACNSNKRLIVLDAVHDEFVRRLTELAEAAQDRRPVPMASRAAAETVDEQVRSAVADGAALVGGVLGEGPAALYSPALLTGVRPAMRIHHEELFGPVAAVYRVADEREAIALANDSPYGLGAAVFGTDEARAAAVADALDVGMVAINSPGADGPELPFGGVKRSGFGRELGLPGLGEFANRRLLHQAGPTESGRADAPHTERSLA